MKKKSMILTIILTLNIITMLFFWYGDKHYVSAISGISILVNPITLICIILYLFGVWHKFKKKYINKWLCIISLIGILIVEIYNTFTWYISTVTGKFDLNFAIYNIRFFAVIGILITAILIPLSIYLKKEN